MKPLATETDLRTKLARVKGLGSAHHGVQTWWRQRVTAVALIPLSLWFVASLVTGLLTPDIGMVADWFASPVNALGLALMLVAGFIHVRIGVQEVLEDYVKCPAMKYTLVLLNYFLNYACLAACLLAILKLHFPDMSSAHV